MGQGYKAQRRDLELGLAHESSSQGSGPPWIETEAEKIYYFATEGRYKASRSPPTSLHVLYCVDHKDGHRQEHSYELYSSVSDFIPENSTLTLWI